MKNPSARARLLPRFLLTASLLALIPLSSASPAQAACATQFVSAALPSIPDDYFLVSASTAGPTSAWAVGPSFSSRTPVALRWDGSSWSDVPVTRTPHTASSLIGVAAVADTDVWAPGYIASRVTRAGAIAGSALQVPTSLALLQSYRPRFTYGPLALHWDGSAWTRSPVPLPRGGSHGSLDRASASSTTDVWSVGTVNLRSRGGRASTLIEHWDGSAWSAVRSPNVGVHDDLLIGVDALSASDAWAVGSRGAPHRTHTLIEHWDGTAWSVVPSGIRRVALYDVSASGPTDAWAVGVKISRSAVTPVILHWDGASWSRASLPAQTSDAVVQGVSAQSSGDAYAVGTTLNPSTGSAQSLVLHWDGSTWSKETTEALGSDDELVGVTADAAGVWTVGLTGGSNLKGLVETPCG
jgi:hypothetical protein